MPPVSNRGRRLCFPNIFERRFIMNDKIAKLLNEQINKEFYSAYL